MFEASTLKFLIGLLFAIILVVVAVLSVLPSVRAATATHVVPYPVDQVYELYSTPERQAE